MHENTDNPDKYFKVECEKCVGFAFSFLFVVSNILCSCFGITFALRWPPPKLIMKALLEDFKAGKKTVISFKYFGLTEKLAPLHPVCVGVCFLPCFCQCLVRPSVRRHFLK